MIKNLSSLWLIMVKFFLTKDKQRLKQNALHFIIRDHVIYVSSNTIFGLKIMKTFVKLVIG